MSAAVFLPNSPDQYMSMGGHDCSPAVAKEKSLSQALFLIDLDQDMRHDAKMVHNRLDLDLAVLDLGAPCGHVDSISGSLGRFGDEFLDFLVDGNDFFDWLAYNFL